MHDGPRTPPGTGAVARPGVCADVGVANCAELGA